MTTGSTPLDLLPREPILRRARGIGIVATVFGVLLALALLTLVPVIVAVLLAVVLAGPVVAFCVATMRRAVWLEGTVLVSRGARTRRIELAGVDAVSLVVRPRGLRLVEVVVGEGRAAIAVPVALYTDVGGRELAALALRRLANALVSGGSVAGVAVAAVLVGALRAHARDAPVEERPLHRAIDVGAGRAPGSARVALEPGEVAELGA